MHVTARAVATHALSIFGDHSDVMACRMTGFAMLCSNSVQEAQDLALIAQAATLQSRVPFLHFFDGFRTSHEVQKISTLPDDILRALIDERHITAFREHGLSPDKPVIRGTAQNPDVFFQAREAGNRFHAAVPDVIRLKMQEFARLTGRSYDLYEYHGAPDAERVVVIMGSGAETCEETADYLCSRGEKVGVV
jgi:pyruvate-ferredoxin/flavodoxin oxidoreductase